MYKKFYLTMETKCKPVAVIRIIKIIIKGKNVFEQCVPTNYIYLS